MKTATINNMNATASPKAFILLVDDEPMVLKMLKTFLTTQNFEVICTSSGQEALAIVEQQHQSIDLVITDIRMPDMDGVRLLDAIHQLFPSLPVILMTGYTDFDLVVKGLKQHAFDLLLKPIDFEQLNWCISRALAFLTTQRLEQQYRTRLEEQVAKQTKLLCVQLEELQEAQRKAGEVEDLKREFLCLISHEFRTPLNGIMGAIQLMEMEETPARQGEYLGMLKTSARRMTNLVSDLLALMEVKSARPTSATATNSTCKAIEALTSRYRERASNAGVCFQAICSDPPDLFLNGPWDALHIAVGCLLDNAIKFTGQGGTVSCHIWTETIAHDQVTVRIRINDSGEGIPFSHQEVIFQPFTQLEHYMTRRNHGIGIGLAIVRSICDKLGGSLTLDSSPGKGSCFTCSLNFTTAQVDQP